MRRLRSLFKRKPKGYRFPNGIPAVPVERPKGLFRLWDNDYSLLASWQEGEHLLVSLDREGSQRQTGVLDLQVSGPWIVYTAPVEGDRLI